MQYNISFDGISHDKGGSFLDSLSNAFVHITNFFNVSFQLFSLHDTQNFESIILHCLLYVFGG
jgi:hypothetical protein